MNIANPNFSLLSLSFFMLVILPSSSFQTTKPMQVNIKVDASKAIHQMKGGMGASWHAISAELPLNNERYSIPVREVGARGSAFGGNPPPSYKKTWSQLTHHASWLGLNFVRVELSQRMYEPERGKFDWDNEEMRALYNILDWAQTHDVDVFLQQMWMYVDWNAFPGIHPLISAPKNLDYFADGITTLLEHLTQVKGYTCIKYFCMTNEPPGGTWGYWWEYGDNKGDISDAWARLKEEFDNRGIKIPISGPDWTDLPPFDESKLGFCQYLGSIDIHSYHGITDQGEATLKQWAEWAHAQSKPFFLTEYGNMNLGWGGDDPNQKSFDAAISNACDVIKGLRAGVDGFNRWSYTNRGNLDGQWQLVRTYNIEAEKYLDEVIPEPEAYYGFGIISRFLSKYSSVVECLVDDPDQHVMGTAMVSPGGQLSIILVNSSSKPMDIRLDLSNAEDNNLYLYQVNKVLVNTAGFKLNPIKKYSSKKVIKLKLPARSIINLTTNNLRDEEVGIFIN
jgi:hypothetical protein